MALAAEPRQCVACGVEEPKGGLRLGTEGGGAEYEWFCRWSVECARRIGQQMVEARKLINRPNYGPLNTREDDGTWGGDPNGWERE